MNWPVFLFLHCPKIVCTSKVTTIAIPKQAKINYEKIQIFCSESKINPIGITILPPSLKTRYDSYQCGPYRKTVNLPIIILISRVEAVPIVF